MSLDIGSILSRAWKITWGNKILWLFGFLAALGGGARFNFNFQFPTQFQPGPGGRPELPPDVERFLERLRSDPTLIAIVAGVFCVLLLLALVFFVLSLLGRGALIGGVRLADANGTVTFGEAWGLGLHNFWRLLLISLVIGVPLVLLALVIFLPLGLLAPVTFGLSLVCLFPLLCVFIIAALVAAIIVHFARLAAVLEDLSVTESLRRAWEVLRANLGPIIVLGLILIVAGAVIELILGLPVILIVAPAIIGFLRSWTTGASAPLRTGLIVAALCFVAYLPVLLALRGVLETWLTSTWTLAYQHFTRPAAAPGSQPAPQIASS